MNRSSSSLEVHQCFLVTVGDNLFLVLVNFEGKVELIRLGVIRGHVDAVYLCSHELIVRVRDLGFELHHGADLDWLEELDCVHVKELGVGLA